jgi:rubrerythrin
MEPKRFFLEESPMRVNLDREGNLVFSDFRPLEAYHLAFHLEERGVDFYERLAAEAQDPELRAGFESLAETERNHARRFQELLDEEALVEGTPSEPFDMAHYLEPGVFRFERSVDDLVEGVETPRDVLDLGIRLEEEVIRFYEGLLGKTVNPGGRKALQEILAEEREHLASLMQWNA